ncbi:RsmD family RNA methyltransferase [Phytoactinopolyspora limicola]|uniref:RsmD family RNA methyltransferase n=1 Tax=Phytoactinopolyspora limicola TaxID=2715536 RepID=UPI00140CCC12|nr:RsmD family RNA methyltransferase [Phytoactinopolyspora limicola]
MTRIVAGSARGRRLRVPPGQATRPTADRVREALFSSLESTLGGFSGVRMLDLYAGSGAVGLEALSRGATHVTFVESAARAVRTIRANVTTVGLPGTSIVHDRVERWLAAGRTPRAAEAPDTSATDAAAASSATSRTADDLQRRSVDRGHPVDLVVADPPYALTTGEMENILALLVRGWLAPDALVVVERDRRSEPIEWPAGLTGLRERAYGETVLWYGRSAGTE